MADVNDLYQLFTQVPDPRSRRGVRHQIASVLTLVVFAVLAGARNFREAADRVRDLPEALLEAAVTRRNPVTGALVVPSVSTIRRVVEGVDAQVADRLVCQWVTERTRKNQSTGSRSGSWCAVAVDGKVVRHSGGYEGRNVTLFSAMLHDQAVVIGQVQVPETTSEVTQIKALLDPVDLSNVVVTADAAHAQRKTARYLRARGAHYVLTVKSNQPSVLWNIRCLLDQVPAPGNHRDIEVRNGRVITRQIWTIPAHGVDFPGVAQVFRIQRDTHDLTGHLLSTDTVYGVTSLPCDGASPAMLAGVVRAHWGIENKIHWVRDAIFREDHQNAYLGAAAHMMALLRNLAIALIRLAGYSQIKRTLEHIAADRTRILPLLAASRPTHQPQL